MAFVPDPPSKFVPDAPPPAQDPIAVANADASAHEQGPVQDVIDMLGAVPSHILPALKGMVDSIKGNPDPDIKGNLQNLIHTITNPQETLSSVGSTLRNATPAQVGANVVAPLVAGMGVGAAGKGVGALAGTSDAAAAEAASPAGQLGLRSTAGRPVATLAAGPSAAPTLAAQNQAAAETTLGADAGVPHGVPVNPTSLAAAHVAPGQVLDAGAASLPTVPLSPAAQAQVVAARGPGTITKPTPNVASQINDIESSLLSGNPVSGEQVRNTRNSLSSDANAGMNSADADTRTIAKYKRAIVSALDQHVEDTLPANAPVTAEQIQNARATSAKNYNLQDLIGKGGDIDLQQLAADHRANPNKFTGNTATVAQFASDHPEVTGGISNADRIMPPGLGADIAHINIVNPRTWVQPLVGAAGRNSLRRLPGAGEVAAEPSPVAGLGGEFNVGPQTAGEASGAAIPMGPLPTQGITATPLTQKLGDMMPGQRGAVGAPVDIGGLRQLMNNPRTYGGGAAVPKTAAETELEKILKQLQDAPHTFSGVPLGQSFSQ